MASYYLDYEKMISYIEKLKEYHKEKYPEKIVYNFGNFLHDIENIHNHRIKHEVPCERDEGAYSNIDTKSIYSELDNLLIKEKIYDIK